VKILQISNKAPYPPNDGSSVAVYNIAKGFIDNGAELNLITINTKKHFKSYNLVPEEFRQKSNYKSIFKDTGVSFFGLILNLFSNESYFVSRFFFKEFESELVKCLINNQFDIIHIEGIFMAPYIPVIKKYSNAKIAIRTHNAEHIIWERHIKNESNFIKKIYLQLQNKRLKKTEIDFLNKADAIVTITESDKQIFTKSGINKKYFVSPTGIDLKRYLIDNTLEKMNTFFHLGSMDWLPNIEGVNWFIEEVYLRFFQNNNDVVFRLAGRFMPKNMFKLSSANLDIQGAIEDNIHFYNQCEVMLVPLRSGSGMRIKIIEGMAMGKVIISTSIGAEGIPISHMENIIIADTPNEFADAITLVCNNEPLKQKIKKNARMFIQNNYDNTILTEQLIKFYNSIIN
jgi:glycosyltransferase involved in cell wall biosynthesis